MSCFKSLAKASEAVYVLFLHALPDVQKVIAPFNSTINASCRLPAAESFSVCRIIVLCACIVKTPRAYDRLLYQWMCLILHFVPVWKRQSRALGHCAQFVSYLQPYAVMLRRMEEEVYGGVIQACSICNGSFEHVEFNPDWNNMVHKWCSMLRFKSHILVLHLFPPLV